MAKPHLFAVAGLAIAAAAIAAPVPVVPAARTFQVGALKVVALRDELNDVPNDGSVFGKGIDPAQVAGVLKAAGAATGSLPLGVDALLVEEPGRTVLIDTGLGPKVGGALPGSLKLAGVDPAKVTDVLITHSHGDHVGGLVTGSGGLAFPNAAVRMTVAEWVWMQSKPANAALVAAITSKVRPFEPGAQLTPAIRSVPLAGHTPGHSGYLIRSGSAQLLDIGDTAHSAVVSLARPDWVIGYDNDAKEGEATRTAELARLAASHERVFAPHFPFPGIGRIEKAGKGYIWRPER